MSTAEAAGMTDVLSRVKNWSPESRIALARRILETLEDRYDMVIVDAPPILSVADTRIVASLTDALILVLRSGVTQREAAMEAYQLIQEDGLALLGTVLTDYDLSSDRRRQYYYDYGDPSRA